MTWLSRQDLAMDTIVTSDLLETLRKDGSKEVSRAICGQLAREPSPETLEQINTVILDPQHPANQICFVALTSTWVAPSLPSPSVPGFERTIAELNRRLTEGVTVPWTVISRLAQGKHLVERTTLSEAQFKKLTDVLERLVHEPKQDVQVRVAAVQALNTYDADSSVFKAIIERYQTATDFEYQLAARARMYLVTDPATTR